MRVILVTGGVQELKFLPSKVEVSSFAYERLEGPTASIACSATFILKGLFFACFLVGFRLNSPCHCRMVLFPGFQGDGAVQVAVDECSMHQSSLVWSCKSTVFAICGTIEPNRITFSTRYCSGALGFLYRCPLGNVLARHE